MGIGVYRKPLETEVLGHDDHMREQHATHPFADVIRVHEQHAECSMGRIPI